MSKTQFPREFLWGTATSAYQIEGAVREGNRGESIWDRFCRTPGKVQDGHTGDVACDHYHRYQSDVGLMADLGLKAYRFSVAWPRIVPDGVGPVNPAGLDFYDRLVDLLLASGIVPFVTLYHWDLPQQLQDLGGWDSRTTAHHFARYADIVSRRLGDRARHWITHNEPWVAAFVGHAFGRHAPGLQDWGVALRAAHHLLLSHGLALQALRSNGARETGIVLNLSPMHPASERSESLAAAQRQDGFLNRWFLDPLYRARYPDDMLKVFRRWQPPIQDGDMELIAAPTEFLGVNYYTRGLVEVDRRVKPLETRPVVPSEAELTDMGWEIFPGGLGELLGRLGREYAPPALYITENGAAFPDAPDGDGVVRDAQRVSFLQQHLEEVQRAIGDGIPIKGYFAWSLLDNFEWDRGYGKRFGIVYVDYETQRRMVKESARWYATAIDTNALALAAGEGRA